jgi:O-antigen/teichoic acid export membrane protein
MAQATLVGLFQPFSSILPSVGRMWFSCLYSAGYVIMFLLGSCLLVPRYGASGLAAAMTITHATISLPCVAYLRLFERQFLAGIWLFPSIALVGVFVFIGVFLSRAFSTPLATITGCVLATLPTLLALEHFRAMVRPTTGKPGLVAAQRERGGVSSEVHLASPQRAEESTRFIAAVED